MKKFMTMAILSSLILTGSVKADSTLPCGPLAMVSHTLTFHAPANLPEAPVLGYRAYMALGGAAFTGGNPIGFPTAAADGTVTFTLSGFENTKTYSVAVTAFGATTESTKSNTVTVPATSSGVCPPNPPPAPTDLTLVN